VFFVMNRQIINRQLTNRRMIFPTFFCVLALSAAVAQEVPVVKPETVGLSPERLERIASTVQRGIDDKRIAGAVTLVSRRGHVAWFKAQGMADREAGKPMRPDTMFRICSMTKPITSTAVMML
jgi:CubicO group peptidase (beta-lactamase class C family)